MIYRLGVGLLLACMGILIVYYSSHIVGFLGELQWAEDKLGGTRKLYIYVGFFLCFVGFLYIFGVLGSGEMDNAMDSGFGTGSI